ncbi:mediator of DNA damage checkpoint protein 1 [Drosophila montana]|uniref:mediator of DNA damage checkpoint protein 1 n=1 Tax=Drosophila montana TaxID=40370 RepID=UPI00313A7BF2
MVALSIDGLNKVPVELEPDIIYRVGRRLGLEFFIDDESIELAHATIVIIAGGIVRVSAATGQVYVKGLETGLEIKSISEADAINGIVDLRFGNVAAKLQFNDGKHLDNGAANDTSGFEEGTKDKSAYRTSGSLIIPESEPQSANNTANMESFTIPETQAICFNRPSNGHEHSKVSLGDDFLIPETQDVMLNVNNPVLLNQDQDIVSEDEGSELGTQIRICTQEFNEYNEDAIDDFDSSLLLGDGGLTVFPPPRQPDDNSGVDLDMSALNWSASNSKCTALNSTKAVDVSSRADICLTPDLSVAGQKSEELNDVPCTPDIFDMFDVEPNERLGSCTPELNLPATVLSSPSIKVDDNEKVCVAKQPAATNIETPEPTPAELQDNSQDFVETQAFPVRSAPTHLQLSNSDDNDEDFIATQAFPMRTVGQRKTNESSDKLQDFIATQAFVRPRPSIPKQNETTSTRLSITAQIHSHNEDFIETQMFPTKTTHPVPSLKPMPNGTEDNFEDFIATQAFIRPQTSVPNKAVDTILNITAQIQNNTEDMMETQLFIPPTNKNDKTAANESSAVILQIPDSIKIGDELDKDLSQLIALSAMPSSPIDDEQHNFDKQSNTLEKTHESKIHQPKEFPNKVDAVQEDQQKSSKNSSRRRVSPRPVSPQASTSKKKRTRQFSKSPTPSGSAASGLENLKIETKTRRKRSSASNEESTAPPKKTRGKTSQPTSDDTVDSKPKKSEASKKKDTIEGSMLVRLRKTRTKTEELSETSTASTHQSEDSINEVKITAETSQEQVRNDNKVVSCSKESKLRKPKQSSDDKPATNQDRQPVSRRTRRQSQLVDIIEANGNEIPINQKPAAKIDDALSTRKELRRSVKAPTEKDTSATKEAKPAPSLRSFRRSTSKTDLTEESREDTAKTKKKVNGGGDVAKTKSSRKTSQEAIESDKEEEPTTSANAPTHNARKNKLPSRKSLKDINDYIKKIKISGRKIRLALSMCNYAELNAVLVSLKNAIEVTTDPLDCDLLIMDKGERTYKFLVGIAANKPILSTKWLHGMKEKRSIIVQSDHIFKDEKFEETFKFKPLSVFENPSLLKGLDFMLAGDIQPNVKEMKAIIECAGGTVHTKAPPIASNVHLYVVASKQDKHIWQLLRNYNNVQYIKAEGVMQALVQRNLELLDEHKLNLSLICK